MWDGDVKWKRQKIETGKIQIFVGRRCVEPG